MAELGARYFVAGTAQEVLHLPAGGRVGIDNQDLFRSRAHASLRLFGLNLLIQLFDDGEEPVHQTS